MDRLIIESLLVGIYCCVIFWMVISFDQFTGQTYNILFITGFFKHLIGYVSGIHYYYCNYNGSCDNLINPLIISESILEGITFIILGFLIKEISATTNTNSTINNMNIDYFNIFIIGFTLHISSDFLGIHDYYCRTRCIDNL
jgi:uncharacterized membrane protein